MACADAVAVARSPIVIRSVTWLRSVTAAVARATPRPRAVAVAWRVTTTGALAAALCVARAVTVARAGASTVAHARRTAAVEGPAPPGPAERPGAWPREDPPPPSVTASTTTIAAIAAATSAPVSGRRRRDASGGRSSTGRASVGIRATVPAVDFARTPDERFDALPDFDYQPRYREWNGLRLAHVDAGEGPPIVLLHGEPTWSFLYRRTLAPLLAAGHRCVVPDLPGFGRSDKPTDVDWYTYDRLTAAIATLFDELDLRDATVVVHDWGGPIGLRVATTERAERVGRIVAMDTGVFTGEQRMGEGWQRFADFVARNPDVPIGRLVAGGCRTTLSDRVLAAYEAPFPSPEHKAAARAMPPLIPQAPDAPGAAEGRAVARALRADRRPALLLWGDSDPALPLEPAGHTMQALLPNADELTVIEGAGHFVAEDRGEQVGALIADWLTTTA